MPVDFGTCLHAPFTSERAIAAEVSLGAAGAGAVLPVPNGAAVRFAGASWVAQSGSVRGVAIGVGGRELHFEAASGEHPAFDGDSKLRAELCGARRYGRGEEIRLSGTFRVDPTTDVADANWCSLVQVHQADMRRADGTEVASSPSFLMGVAERADGTRRLHVTILSSRGVPAPGEYPPTVELADRPVRFGADYRFEIVFVDGHGGPGRVLVRIDDTTLVDRSDLLTGAEYVDLLARAQSVEQPTGSYLKLGVYAGWNTDFDRAHRVRASLLMRDVQIGP